MKWTIWILALSLTTACTGNPKPKAVRAYQGVELALGALQDAEREAFAAGLVPEAIHRQTISPAFSKAFEAQIAFGSALKAWQPDRSPVPDGYDAWLAAVDGAAKAVAIVSPTHAAVAEAALQWARLVMQTVTLFKQPAPASVLALGWVS